MLLHLGLYYIQGCFLHLGPLRHWRTPSIYLEKERFIYLWDLEFRSWLRPRAVSRLRASFARDEIIKSLRLEQIHFPFPYTICLLMFFAAELSLILQRLILFRFRDRKSMVDSNFGNTWRVFRVKLIEKVARTLFHSLLFFLLRWSCPIFFY